MAQNKNVDGMRYPSVDDLLKNDPALLYVSKNNICEDYHKYQLALSLGKKYRLTICSILLNRFCDGSDSLDMVKERKKVKCRKKI